MQDTWNERNMKYKNKKISAKSQTEGGNMSSKISAISYKTNGGSENHGGKCQEELTAWRLKKVRISNL